MELNNVKIECCNDDGTFNREMNKAFRKLCADNGVVVSDRVDFSHELFLSVIDHKLYHIGNGQEFNEQPEREITMKYHADGYRCDEFDVSQSEINDAVHQPVRNIRLMLEKDIEQSHAVHELKELFNQLGDSLITGMSSDHDRIVVHHRTKPKADDAVHQPKHYELMEGVESIEIIAASLTEAEWRGFCLGNAVKYRLRAGKKDALQQDIDKANNYTDNLFPSLKHLNRNDR